ncbi:hypothetical protein [Modestobacter sp. URMC 112]
MTTREGPGHPSTSASRAGTPVRVLVVLALLVGLFGMHGLGADHSVAAPGAHGEVLAGPVSPAGHPAPARHAAPAADAQVAVLGHAAPSSHHGPADGHPTDTAQTCVAVLAGAALLALLLPGVVRALPLARPALHRSALRTRVPPLPALRPSDLSVLCVLCVLRT